MVIMRITALLLILVLGGCQYVNVKSTQLSAVTSQVRATVSAFFSDTEALPSSLWAVQFGGYSAAVQPVLTDKVTVFVNNLDAISFDGWRIIKVSGLNSFIPAWEIQDSGSERAFVVDGQVVAKHQCDQWLKYDTETGVRFEQQCTGKQAYTNTISVDSLGQIFSIEQVVDSTFMKLHLRLNK
jgi:hypothetical protein